MILDNRLFFLATIYRGTMKRKTKNSITIVSRTLLKILGVGTLITIAGLLSQGRNTDKLIKGLGKYSVWEIKRMLRTLKIQKLITYDEQDEHSPIMITEKGFVAL